MNTLADAKADRSPPATEKVKASVPVARQYLMVHGRTFSLIWFGVFILHSISIVFYASMGRFYWITGGTFLGNSLDRYGVGLATTHYRALSKVHFIIAGFHGVLVLLMIFWSLRSRELSFGYNQETPIRKLFDRLLRPRGSTRTVMRMRERASQKLFDWMFGLTGVLGVEGKYFDLLLILREVVETSLQSLQAYNMSIHVPRPWLNRLYVSLLVINCSLTPLLHELFSRKVLVRRVLLLVCDAILDFFSSVLLPSLIVMSYLPEYSVTNSASTAILWLNDSWNVNAVNELQLVLITSWGDLASRIIFSVSLIGCLENAKRLVRRSSGEKATGVRVEPLESSASVTLVGDSSHFSGFVSLHPHHHQRRFERTLNLCFGIWALMVLVMHVQSESVPRLEQCAIQVRPWMRRQATCAMLLLDCERSGILGEREKVSNKWTILEQAGVIRIVVRHCPQLAVPPELQRFHATITLKVYNSTIAAWPSESALTSDHHSALRTITMVRVQFPNGELPAGLAGSDFPRGVKSIQVCASNLRSLPSDLGSKWPLSVYYLFEESMFESVPAVLEQLQPAQLSFSRNRLTEFPFHALGWRGMKILNVGGNNISTMFLPTGHASVVLSPQMLLVVVGESNVSVLPRWVDSFVELRAPVSRWGLFLDKTPFCDHAKAIASGKLASFSGLDGIPLPSQSTFMTVTHANASLVTQSVLCRPYNVLFYPLASEDEMNGIPTSTS